MVYENNYMDGIPPNEDYGFNGSADANNYTVDDHFAFFKQLCNQANDYRLVQTAKGLYGSTKQSCGLLERTLDKVENGAYGALDYTAPLYENYLYGPANRLLNTYNRGVENTKSIKERSVGVARTSGTLSMGLMLIAAEMGLVASAASTRFALDAAIGARNKSFQALNSCISVEQYVEERIREAIQSTYDIYENPSKKFNEHTNSFLDVANRVFSRILSLPEEQEDKDACLTERVKFLTTRVAKGVGESANQNLLEPCQAQIQVVLEQLQKSMIVIEYLKEGKNKTFEKMDNISDSMFTSVNDFRVNAKKEADEILTNPEDTLIRYIHTWSNTLTQEFTTLRERGEELLNEKTQKKVNEAVDYVTQFSSNLQNADDLYTANDEVIDEMKKRLAVVYEWASSAKKND